MVDVDREMERDRESTVPFVMKEPDEVINPPHPSKAGEKLQLVFTKRGNFAYYEQTDGELKTIQSRHHVCDDNELAQVLALYDDGLLVQYPGVAGNNIVKCEVPDATD